MKKFIVLIAVLLVPLFSFDNHFVGLVSHSGNLGKPSDDKISIGLDDYSFISAGFKTGMVTDNVYVYADYQHFTFSIESTNKSYNEDLLSFGIGPIFNLSQCERDCVYCDNVCDGFWNQLDLKLYINGLAVFDKINFAEEVNEGNYNKYVSKYNMYLGYEFGLIIPTTLNPFHNQHDSFVEFGYRQVYRNSSVLDSASKESNTGSDVEAELFKDISSFFIGLNFLF